MSDLIFAASATTEAAAAARRRRTSIRLPLRPYLLLLPSLIFLTLFTFLPIIEVAWSSLFRTAYGQHDASFVGFGYYMLFYLAGLQAIPSDLGEAAKLDGASSWQRLRHITLPLLAPTTGFVAVIALINVITAVDHVVVLTRGGPNGATNLLLYYIYQNANEFYDAGKATAATVISVAILLTLSLLGLRTLERGADHAE